MLMALKEARNNKYLATITHKGTRDSFWHVKALSTYPALYHDSLNGPIRFIYSRICWCMYSRSISNTLRARSISDYLFTCIFS
jgi:hypothetical protein